MSPLGGKGTVGGVVATAQNSGHFRKRRTLSFEPLLTPVEAASFLRIHQKTAIRLAREGDLPGLRIGKHWRFRSSDLAVWAESKVGSSRQPEAE
jgi:excisionase family DNA binding protein